MSDNNIDKGKGLLEKGNFLEAIEIFDAILDENPFHPEALHNRIMASINLDTKEDDNVLPVYKTIKLGISIEKSNELNNIGADLAMMGRYQEALNYYEQSLKANPRNHLTLANKGLACAKLGNPEEGLKLLERALSIEPNYMDGLINIALPLQMLGRSDDAIKYLDEALSLNPKSLRVLINKGVLLSGQENYEKAIGCFEEVLKLDPNNNDAIHNRNLALKSLESMKKGDNRHLKTGETKITEDVYQLITDDLNDLEKLSRDGEFFQPNRKLLYRKHFTNVPEGYQPPPIPIQVILLTIITRRQLVDIFKKLYQNKLEILKRITLDIIVNGLINRLDGKESKLPWSIFSYEETKFPIEIEHANPKTRKDFRISFKDASPVFDVEIGRSRDPQGIPQITAFGYSGYFDTAITAYFTKVKNNELDFVVLLLQSKKIKM